MHNKYLYINCFDFPTGAEVLNVEALLTDSPVHKIILYRAFLKDNLIEVFKDPEILQVNLDVTLIGDNGKEEEGKGAGVFRDTSFWSQNFNSLTVGTQEKVPAIRHDYQRAEWEAIARILMCGYIRRDIFPFHCHELSFHYAFLVKKA